MSVTIRNGHVLADSQRLAKLAADDAAPKWNQLFPLGTRFRRDFPDGKVDFTADYLTTMLGNWQDAGKPALPVDYFHRGPSFEEGANEDKVAAGWIEDLQLRDDGLYALIKWTDKARNFILADELRYLSPMFAHNAMSRTKGKLQGPTLAGAALLNDPFLQDLPAVAASDTIKESRGGSDSLRVHEVTSVDKSKICAALGIDVNSTDDAVLSALSGMRSKLSDFEKTGHKMTADVEAKLSANEGALKLANEQISKLQTDLKKQAEEVATKEVADVVAKLEAGHHIVADQKDKVIAYAKATSAKEAWETFSKFSAVPKGELGTNVDPNLHADSPEAAYTKLTALAKEKAKAEKISIADAKAALYDEPALQSLVALANRNTANQKRS